MTDTQVAALVHIKESGADQQIASKMCDRYRAYGPMTDFEMRTKMPNTTTCLLARRRELTQAGIVGTMGYTRVNPDSEEDCMVWGLIHEHSAMPYYPPDTVSLRLHGERLTAKVDLTTITDMQLGGVVRHMLEDLRAIVAEKERKAHEYARGQGQKQVQQAS